MSNLFLIFLAFAGVAVIIGIIFVLSILKKTDEPKALDDITQDNLDNLKPLTEEELQAMAAGAPLEKTPSITTETPPPAGEEPAFQTESPLAEEPLLKEESPLKDEPFLKDDLPPEPKKKGKFSFKLNLNILTELKSKLKFGKKKKTSSLNLSDSLHLHDINDAPDSFPAEDQTPPIDTPAPPLLGGEESDTGTASLKTMPPIPESQNSQESEMVELTPEETQRIEAQIEHSDTMDDLQSKYNTINKLFQEKSSLLEKAEQSLQAELNHRKEFNKLKDLLEKEIKDHKEDKKKIQQELNEKNTEIENYKRQIQRLEDQLLPAQEQPPQPPEPATPPQPEGEEDIDKTPPSSEESPPAAKPYFAEETTPSADEPTIDLSQPSTDDDHQDIPSQKDDEPEAGEEKETVSLRPDVVTEDTESSGEDESDTAKEQKLDDNPSQEKEKES